MKRINALQLRRSVGKVVSALQKTGEPILLEKGRRPVAAIISLRDYRERFVEKATAEELDRVLVSIDRLARRSADPTSAVDILREMRGGDHQTKGTRRYRTRF